MITHLDLHEDRARTLQREAAEARLLRPRTSTPGTGGASARRRRRWPRTT